MTSPAWDCNLVDLLLVVGEFIKMKNYNRNQVLIPEGNVLALLIHKHFLFMD